MFGQEEKGVWIDLVVRGIKLISGSVVRQTLPGYHASILQKGDRILAVSPDSMKSVASSRKHSGKGGSRCHCHIE
jgi:hypothetical protein